MYNKLAAPGAGVSYIIRSSDAMAITVVMFGKFVCTFSYGKVKDNFLDKDQIASREGKRKG